MRVLLDTHAFLWFVLKHPRLGVTASTLLNDPRNEVLLSPVTYWEVAIKISTGRYQLPEPFEPFIQDQIDLNGFIDLPITVAHTAQVSRLPFHHRDPFDRLLVAQAIVESVPILSADTMLDSYPATRVW